MCETPCATVLLLEFGVKTLCATVVVIEIGNFCLKATTCLKPLAQLSCCLKFGCKHSAQLTLYLNLASFVTNLKLIQNTVRNCPIARNWHQKSLRNCRFCSKLAFFVKKRNGQFQATALLRAMFWTNFSFLTKVPNFKQNVSCAACLDPLFKQHDSCARCFGQVLAF